MQELTQKSIQKIIEKFWHLNASKAPIKEFLPLVAPDFCIQLGFKDIKFTGIAEFADHQIGKLCFFDQKFELLSMDSKIQGDTATVVTKAVWHASTWVQNAAYSHRLIADLTHTWEMGLSQEKDRVVIFGHICDALHYRKGHAPQEAELDFHLQLK